MPDWSLQQWLKVIGAIATIAGVGSASGVGYLRSGDAETAAQIVDAKIGTAAGAIAEDMNRIEDNHREDTRELRKELGKLRDRLTDYIQEHP